MDDRNLYAPPAAAVADPVVATAARPREVTWAMICIWTWLAVTIGQRALPAAITLVNASLGIGEILIFFVLPMGLPAVIAAWINSNIAQGRNWARIVVVIFFAISLVYRAFQWKAYLLVLNPKTALAALQLVKLPLDTAAVVLLFLPRSNRWFKARSTADS